MTPERITDQIRTMAAEVAAVLGYTRFADQPLMGLFDSFASYDNPRDKTVIPKKRAKAFSYGHGPAIPRVILNHRGLTLTHPDYRISILVDSTYDNWHVYTEGNISGIERLLLPLFHEPSSSWKVIEEPWQTDLIRRLALTRKKWDELSPSRPDPDIPANAPALKPSTPPTSPTVPKFGDLSSLAKPTPTKRTRRRN